MWTICEVFEWDMFIIIVFSLDRSVCRLGINAKAEILLKKT